MPVKFSALPYSVQVMMTEKLSMSTLAAFKEASELTNQRSERVCARTVQVIPPRVTEEVYFSFYNGELSFRFDYDEEYFDDYLTPCRWNQREVMKNMSHLSGLRFKAEKMFLTVELSEEFCAAMADYFEESGSSIHELEIGNADCRPDITCTPPTFQKFLEASQLFFLNCGWGIEIPRELFKCIPQNVESISGITQIEDGDFIARNIENMDLEETSLTSSGINTILKDWIEGRTKINRLSIDTSNHLSVDDVMRDLRFSSKRGQHFIEIMNIHRQRMEVSIDEFSVNLTTRPPNF